jgi:electron-transferring-flavoprotein dehydrogenase
MLAAEAAFAALQAGRQNDSLTAYSEAVEHSWIAQELKAVRNIRPAFHYGLGVGLLNAALETYILRGKSWWTLPHRADYTQMKPAAQCQPIAYPPADGVTRFDRMSSVYLSNTHHEENQPVHLQLRDAALAITGDYRRYAGSAARYCPAGVYEYLEDTASGEVKLQINAQNCVHCKTCDIKEVQQNIRWTPPEGGGGPCYPQM